MKKSIFSFLLLCSFLNTKADSTSLIQIKNQLNELSKTILGQKTIEDSLKRELNFYKVKEDFYAAALSDQGTRFSLIIAGILSLVGLISWITYKTELSKLKVAMQNRIQGVEKGFEAFRSNSLIQEKDLKIASGNVFAAIGQLPTLTPIDSFYYHLLAANSFWETHKFIKENSKILNEPKEKDYIFTSLSNLQHVDNLINRFKTDKLNAKTKLESKKTDILKILDNLLDSKDHSIITLALKIRSEFTQLLD